ncbi:MAG: DUF1538 domain-containing protein [Clostridiales bacterium]|jgi:hypothetical protein|nr:DUF1538 domain-containing protein [Clostridiales bacterium]
MKFLRSLKEVFLSSLPLLAVMVVVCVFVDPMSGSELLKISIGYIMVIFGQTLFLIGLESSIIPIGKLVGGSLVKLKKTVLIVLFGFVFGLLATVAEPALAVLGVQVNSINGAIDKTLFVWLLGIGVGVAVAAAMYRVIKNINIKIIFAAFYIVTFIIVFFTPTQFRALAFDGSGATTGDVSVPFILALGLGVSATMSKSKTNDESFGIIGIASVGPIIALFIYGMFLGNAEPVNLHLYDAGAGAVFSEIFFGNFKDVALAIVPVFAIFFIFQFAFIKLPKKHLLRILLAGVVVYIGLHIFLTGVDFGFALAAKRIGDAFTENAAHGWMKWLLLPVGFILGFAITLSEPAVTVLGEQVEAITNGYIKKTVIRLTLAVGIGFAAFLSLLKILTNADILLFLLPLYAISLILMIFTPKLFVGLAFDSGGVTGGAITSAFLTPLTLAVTSNALNDAGSGDILTSGFGVIAFISVMPLIAVQLLGIIYAAKLKKAKALEEQTEIFGHTVGENTAAAPPVQNGGLAADEGIAKESTLADDLDKLDGLY